MMRRSGCSPEVKRSKLPRVMLRRAASGHMEATQLLKFAAASRIALAVIKGWPEAPSSPLQGGGAPPGPGAACGCDGVDFCPEKMLSKKFEMPSPELWAPAATGDKSVTASASAPAQAIVDGAIRRCICLTRPPKYPAFTRTRPGFQQFNKGRIAVPPFRRTIHPPLFPAANR